ncbi:MULTISPECIES: DUF7289 family protein [Haloarcula]|jgi:type II secretory pathway pseudopilin PulG|uniref:Flagellin n=1 Tax=Haloarcula marismortui ATCC 33799 TaxID=662475 RepID=M0L4Q3_9EURY|nr:MULTISPECIES: hypothetical protein [Haloarcula]EMA26975.1 hypothetical protein C435_00025 [Haloarcula californiae ATCC 33799]NHN66044.1 hypothetical protein [Haloarcula sp. JP-Z28]
MNDRGISESLGFVLVFSIIVLSLGLVSTVGLSQIEEVRNDQQLENAERSFQIVAQNIDELQTGQSVARGGELDLNRGRIRLIPSTDSQLRVSVRNTTGPDAYEATYELSGVEYQLDGTTVGYEGGAVFRRDKGGTAVVGSPTLVCTDEHALVSLVTIDGVEGRQLGGGTVSVTAERENATVSFPVNRTGRNSTAGRANVSVEVVSSQFESGWNQYLESQEGWHSSGSEFVCDGNGSGVQTYQIVKTHVNVTFTR